MVHSVPTRQLVFSSRPVVRTVRYVIPVVGTIGQVGEYTFAQFAIYGNANDVLTST